MSAKHSKCMYKVGSGEKVKTDYKATHRTTTQILELREEAETLHYGGLYMPDSSNAHARGRYEHSNLRKCFCFDAHDNICCTTMALDLKLCSRSACGYCLRLSEFES